MKCKQAVVIIGYYVAGMIGEYKDMVNKNGIYDQVHKMVAQEGLDVAYLDELMEGESINRLCDIIYLGELGREVLKMGQCIENIHTDRDYEYCWFDGGEDIGFYLVEIGQSIVAGVELVQELDPMEEYTIEYLKELVGVL